MNEIICIDAKFSNEQLEFWKKHDVTHPEQDKIYTCREVIRHTTGDVGILLNEIVNKSIPIKHPILNTIEREVTWNIKRFTNLLGNKISESMLKEQTVKN